MAVFFLFFTVQFGVTSLLEERNEGTLARLLAAPVSRASILGGKLLTSFLLGIISMTVLVVATTVLFGAAWGNPFGVAVLIVTAIMAATGIMALIATLARNAEQAANWQSVTAVILGLIGGTFFPYRRRRGSCPGSPSWRPRRGSCAAWVTCAVPASRRCGHRPWPCWPSPRSRGPWPFSG